VLFILAPLLAKDVYIKWGSVVHGGRPLVYFKR